MTTAPGTNSGLHAHLLAMEMCGQPARETPTEVIDEVEFRATYVSSLLQEMFRDAQTRKVVEVYEFWD